MTDTQLVLMHTPPQDGWDEFIGTYWVRRGLAFKHTTERQSQITVTLTRNHDWRDYFEVVSP